MEKPYFYINGHNFYVGTDAKSKSEVNLVKTRMFVSGENWGYNDIQWTNFTGETLTCNIFSRVDDVYTGEPAQPTIAGIYDFYNSPRTPHAVLKYWAQNFVPCNILTNLEAFESGVYVIDEFSQSNPSTYFIKTELSFIQYEKPGQIDQTYWSNQQIGWKSTTELSAQWKEVNALGNHAQDCSCDQNTPSEKCTARVDKEVEVIQKYLQQWGYFPSYTDGEKISVNGRFCYNTTQALRRFQEHRGIEITGNFNDLTKEHFKRILGGT